MITKAYIRALQDFKHKRELILEQALHTKDVTGTYEELNALEMAGAVQMVQARVAKMRRGWR